MKELIQKGIKEQKGAALIMALLILSLTIVSSVALSRVILGEIRMTINTKNSLNAFYAADSAIEKALYYIKYSSINSDDASLEAFKGETFLMNPSEQSFNFVSISTTTPGFVFYNVSTSTPAHIDITSSDGDFPTSIDWNPDVFATSHTYELDWIIEDCFPRHASDKLEITSYSFNNNPFDVSTKKDIIICDCSYNINPSISDLCEFVPQTIFDSNFYRFSFRPLDGMVSSMFFKVFDNNNTLVDTTSHTLVIADGIYKNATHRLQVEIPATAPLADIFSYVIFSEEVLRKE